MYTGIVEELGTVVGRSPVSTEWGQGVRLTIRAGAVLDDSEVGSSIAVDGCGLTMVARGEDWWATDLSHETLASTTLDQLVVGDRVNLERSITLTTRINGHIVLGHIDCIGEIVAPAPDLVVRVPTEHMRFLIERGSVAVDGISLTAFRLTADTFSVSIIPRTGDGTTLRVKGPGAKVNVEVDVIAKHLDRLLAARQP